MNIAKNYQGAVAWVTTQRKRVWNPVKKQVRSRPMTSFFVSLAVLFGVIFLVNWLNRPMPDTTEGEERVKQVHTYSIGEAPTVSVQAKVVKSGVVTVYAQTPGVVQRINITEGGKVAAGQTLVSLASTYGGANQASLQRSIAQVQYQNTIETFDTQMELIDKRREVANLNEENADKMREISRESLDRTRDVLNVNEEILNMVNDNIEELQELPQTDETEALLLQTKQQKTQLLSGINSLKTSIANVEATSDDDDPAARLNDLNKEITLKGLELEEKGLKLSREVAGLQLKIARVGEMLYYPQSPFTGVVERVFVTPGQLVNPGQPLAAVAGSDQSVKVVALVSADIAQRTSRFDTSTLVWSGNSIEQVPQYIATEPTDGNLHAITWCQLDEFADVLENLEYIQVDMPVGAPDTGGAVPYLPIDSIHQTQDQAFVFVIEEGKARGREVDLGSVYGSFIQIESGLDSGEEIILDRTVVSGDKVERI